MSHHYSGPNVAFPRGDARFDFTDLFAFPKPGDTSKSILIMDLHPVGGHCTRRDRRLLSLSRLSALYELRIDTDGDAVADIAYQVRFASAKDGGQTATLRRFEGAQPTGRARCGKSSPRGSGLDGAGGPGHQCG